MLAGALGLLLLAGLADEAIGQRASLAGRQERGGQTEEKNASASDDLADVGRRFTQLTRVATWQLVRKTPVKFRTHHPQGMARVESGFFLSSVEVTKPRRPISEGAAEERDDEYEQTPGVGKAHLFRINAQGERTGAVELSEGSMYHPGGIDYDGRSLWVPVGEYRPDSRSIIYRVDPQTMKATEILKADDHIGAVVYDAANELLYGVNWSAKQFYTWDLSEHQGLSGRRTSSGPGTRAPSRTVRNSSFYIAYQDCQFVAEHYALCGGLRDYPVPGGRGEMALGGLELVDLEATAPVWQLPLSLYASPGVPMTRNPLYAEPKADGGLRFYFAPEDDETTIYVYDAAAP